MVDIFIPLSVLYVLPRWPELMQREKALSDPTVPMHVNIGGARMEVAKEILDKGEIVYHFFSI